MTKVSSQRVRHISELNEQDIRSATARGLAALLTVAALLLWWRLLFLDRPNLELLAAVTTLFPTFAIAYWLGGRYPSLSGGILVVACAGGLAVLVRVGDDHALSVLFVLPAVIAFGVFGWRAGLIVGILAVVLAAVSLYGGPAAIAGCGLALALLAFGLVLLPRERILGWSWQRSAEATYLAEQLRDRQGELNKALSALRLAYQLLERTNRELAVAKQEADEARHLKEEFAANVSHELRTPLNIILGFAEIMHRTPGVYGLEQWPQMLRRDVAEIWRSAKHIGELVDDILELARVDALQMPVTREVTDLAAIIEDTCTLGERLLHNRPIVLEKQIEASLPLVSVDRTRIRQVLLNLLSNAARFTDKGRIELAARREGDEILVLVSDTGVGIEAHELQSIFQEFRRVERHQERGGKGLGLAIAKRFVQLHGGRIWAESEVGVGSTFYFTLPIEEKQVSRLRSGAGGELRSDVLPKVAVLRAPNGSDAPAFFARHLEGYDVLGAEDMAALSRLVNEEHPLAVLADATGADCRDVVMSVAATLPETLPVLGLAVPGLHLAGDDGVFDGFLTKPVLDDDLTNTIDRFAGARVVMVVDDDRDFVHLMRRMLAAQQPHLEVRWAYDGQEALDMLETVKPDVVLVDMVMPVMDGVALARAIRARGSGIAIIAVSGASPMLRDVHVQDFYLSKRSGLRDREVLALVRSCLANVRAEYAVSVPTF